MKILIVGGGGGGGMVDFSKKKNSDWFRWGKKTLPKKYLGKNSGTEKKIYLMVYNADKNILHNYMSGEKFYLHRFVGKKSLTQTKSNPLQPTKSNGQMERKYQPQFGEKEPSTLERERKKSRLGQTQFDVFNKRLKYT